MEAEAEAEAEGECKGMPRKEWISRDTDPS